MNSKYVQVSPNLAVLDTNIRPLEWTVPQENFNVPSLVHHTANLVGNYMIIAFGKQARTLRNPKWPTNVINVRRPVYYITRDFWLLKNSPWNTYENGKRRDHQAGQMMTGLQLFMVLYVFMTVQYKTMFHFLSHSSSHV